MKKLIFLSIFCLLSSICFSQRISLRSTSQPFFHGVASGDPLPNQVMIWTRVTPDTIANTEIEVYWQIATDISFTNIVNFGYTSAIDSNDYTVKLDVCGLQPNTYYYYMFHALGENSLIGRTKTAPSASANNAQAKFAVTSCSSYEHGYFNAYESISNRNDLDAIIHLGDYIYEYNAGGYSSGISGRDYEPTNEIITIDDYRTRHSHYKLDEDLQRLHQLYPFITTWDDHESANDSYEDGAQNHNGGEGPWVDRKNNASQAYKEWMPIRNPDPMNDLKIWRNLKYGNLLDLMVVDSRLWGRDEQDLLNTNSNTRTILGNDQFSWLENNLSTTSSKWKIICNQVMMAPLEIFGIPVNQDQWDGYNYDRNRLIGHIENNNIQNTVVLTGDIHTSWANNVPGNIWTNAMTEFVTTSVTSPGFPFSVGSGLIQTFNPHMQYIDLTEHGYLVLTVTDSAAQGDYVYVDNVTSPSFSETVAASWKVNENTQNMINAGVEVPLESGPIIPPFNTVSMISLVEVPNSIHVTTLENNTVIECVLPNVSSTCPNVYSEIINDPFFGTAVLNNFCVDYSPFTNYSGVDSFSVLICPPGDSINCDTTWIFIYITPDNSPETFSYNIDFDSTLTDCLFFDDLVSIPTTTSFNYSGTGSFGLIDDSCFIYTPNSSFCGIDMATVIACDSLGICDTVFVEIIVNNITKTDTFFISGTSGNLISDCYTFDDVFGSIVTSNIEFTGNSLNNALHFNDTCFSYLSTDSFTGIDTVTLFVCDDFIPQKCDTVVYLLEMTPLLDTITSINDFPLAVLGVYPNPVDDALLIQYYTFDNTKVELQLVDISGKIVFQDQINLGNSGLQYAQIHTKTLAPGTYFLKLVSKGKVYTRQLLKQ